LILKVYDNEQKYVFDCIRIEQFKKKYPIVKYGFAKYSKIERSKIMKFIDDVHDDFFKILGTVSTNKSEKVPYEPLELE
jgi:hypothetical protein